MTCYSASIFAAVVLLAPPGYAGQAATPPKPPPSAQKAQPAAPAPSPSVPAPPQPAASPTDPTLDAAQNLIGKALFLRGFYLANNLSYDAAGKIEGATKPGEWTLAAINILKATHPAFDVIELDGVRAAIRYNPDAHEFQRHPLNDEKMKFLVKLTPSDPAATARLLRAAFAAIFAIGIDPALQHSMPPLWSHYFDPNLAWPPDPLTGATIYPMFGQPDQPKDVTPPVLIHQVDPQFNDIAARDKVKGQVQLRVVIDAQGVPRRIVVSRPLGYGLEQQAAEAMSQGRFSPAIRAGVPVPAAIVVNIDFATVPTK